MRGEDPVPVLVVVYRRALLLIGVLCGLIELKRGLDVVVLRVPMGAKRISRWADGRGRR